MADDFRFARNSMAILKSTIEMAHSQSFMAPVLAIDSSITRGLRAGAEDEDRPLSEAVTLSRGGDETGEQRLC